MWWSAPKLLLTFLSSCLIFHFIFSVEWDWVRITALSVNTAALHFSNSQSSRRVHPSACVFLCSRCWWDLRGNVVRRKAAGSLSITLTSPMWSYVLLHFSCFDTRIFTSLFQCCCRLKPQAGLEVTMLHFSSPVMLHSLCKLAEKVFPRWFCTYLSLCLLQPRLQN